MLTITDIKARLMRVTVGANAGGTSDSDTTAQPTEIPQYNVYFGDQPVHFGDTPIVLQGQGD